MAEISASSLPPGFSDLSAFPLAERPLHLRQRFHPELASALCALIAERGLTPLKAGVLVSLRPESVRRWQRLYPAFNQQIAEAQATYRALVATKAMPLPASSDPATNSQLGCPEFAAPDPAASGLLSPAMAASFAALATTAAPSPEELSPAVEPPAPASASPGPGRRSLYTPAIVELICSHIRTDGVSDTRAGVLAGVAAATISLWKESHPEFSQQLEHARTEYQRDCLDEIRNASTSGGTLDWRARAWLLERAFPQEFGRQSRRPASEPAASAKSPTCPAPAP